MSLACTFVIPGANRLCGQWPHRHLHEPAGDCVWAWSHHDYAPPDYPETAAQLAAELTVTARELTTTVRALAALVARMEAA